MLSVISPAKRLDFETEASFSGFSHPEFLKQSEALINKLRRTSGKQIGSLMNISNDLVQLNKERYDNWSPNHAPSNAKQAILAFQGDVYIGLQANEMDESDLEFAQEHLRILSGLYGVLKPLDLMQPYRLEMGTQLPIRRKKNLYEFWGDQITMKINEAIENSGSDVLVNLASTEYFKAVDKRSINGRIVTPNFLDWKNGKYKPIQFFLKKARGFMLRYIIENRINDAEDLKGFNLEGYVFDESLSEENAPVFTRKEN